MVGKDMAKGSLWTISGEIGIEFSSYPSKKDQVWPCVAEDE
jgi:hypothetical protein